MKTWTTKRLNRIFLLVFVVLTFFCWCPVFGSYGEATRVFGVPAWVVVAFGIGTLMFILEWIYLFRSGLTIDDEILREIVSELEAAGGRRSDLSPSSRAEEGE